MSQFHVHSSFLSVSQPQIGQLVRELRQTLNLTQEKFAHQLGVTFPTVNRWENGHATPSPLALKQIESLLHQLAQSADPALHDRAQALTEQYCLSIKSLVKLNP